MACAVAAVCAPTAGAAPTVDNTHPGNVTPTGVTYADDSTADSTLALSLVPNLDGTGNDVLFGATALTTPTFAQGLDPADPTNDCVAGAPSNTVQCPPLPATITLGTGNDKVQLAAGLPAVQIDGNLGTDTIDFGGQPAGMSINLGATDPNNPALADAAPGVTVTRVEGAAGTDLGDTITGDASANPLSGNGGDDTIDGGGGDDALSGNAGDDSLSGNVGDDTVSGGDGIDTLNGGAGGDTLDGNVGDDTLNGDTGNDTLSGSVGDDTLNGNDGNDTLNGDDGNDKLDGGAGVNTLRGGDGNDTLTGTAGADNTLIGGPGVDTFVGGSGPDQIVAIDGIADTITCSAGKTDTVFADLGADGIVDNITNPTDCFKITGTVAKTTTVTTTETLQPVIVVPSSPTGPVPVLAPGKASFADLTPPAASMRSFTRQRLATVANRGVPLRVTCKEACGISVAISVDRTTARRLKLDSRVSPVIIATASATRRSAGTTQLRVKFTKKAAAALKKSKRGVVATTQVLVSDASGNGTLLSRHVTFVR